MHSILESVWSLTCAAGSRPRLGTSGQTRRSLQKTRFSISEGFAIKILTPRSWCGASLRTAEELADNAAR